MNFAAINNALPEELADRIARDAHKRQFKHIGFDIIMEASAVMSDFDKAVTKGVPTNFNIKEYMVKKYGDRVKVVDYRYMHQATIVFVFPTTSRFAFYHAYDEFYDDVEEYLVDGSFTHDTIKVERYLRVHNGDSGSTRCTEILNHYPFNEILPGVRDVTFDLSDAGEAGDKYWKWPGKIRNAFHRFFFH